MATVHNDAIAKLMAGLYLTLRGTPIMYYGEEIGMENNDPKSKEDVKDPIGITGWPKEKGRDGERTPMQWDAGPQAGFSSAAMTWLPIPSSYRKINVKTESSDSDSALRWYRELIALRRMQPALRDGAITMLDRSNTHVLSYLRRTDTGEAVIVAMNFTAQLQTISWIFPAAAQRVRR
jgi:alpha-glucosidase